LTLSTTILKLQSLLRMLISRVEKVKEMRSALFSVDATPQNRDNSLLRVQTNNHHRFSSKLPICDCFKKALTLPLKERDKLEAEKVHQSSIFQPVLTAKYLPISLHSSLKFNFMKTNLFSFVTAIGLLLGSCSLMAQVSILNDQGDTLMSVQEDGSMGIGTDSPRKLLEVYNDFDGPHAVMVTNPSTDSVARAQVYLRNGDVDAIGAAAHESDAAFFGTMTNHDIRFTTHDTAKMIITAAGDVGIGTLVPDEKLHVIGSIKVEGMDNGALSDSLVTWSAVDSTFHVIHVDRLGVAPLATYSIGDIALGGVVFYVNAEGTHGLVVAQQDQMSNVNWYDAHDNLNNPINHDVLGEQYLDWRLPSKLELKLIYNNLNKHMPSSIGRFTGHFYWSSTEHINDAATVHSFSDGNQTISNKHNTCFVRAVRAF